MQNAYKNKQKIAKRDKTNVKYIPYFLRMVYIFCNKKALWKKVKILLNS